jgi:hypothetical protein
MSNITQTGKLPFGIEVDGKLHRDFELRIALLDDNIEAIDEVGTANPLKLSVAITARQIVRLGDLPKEQITTALVRQLRTEDWNALDAAATELVKKSAPPNSG